MLPTTRTSGRQHACRVSVTLVVVATPVVVVAEAAMRRLAVRRAAKMASPQNGVDSPSSDIADIHFARV